MTWPTKKLGEICEKLALKKAPEGVTPYIEIGDINIETKEIKLKEKGAVKGSIFAPANCVIVSRVRPTRGAVALLDKKIAISSAFTILEPNSSLELKFLFYCLAYNTNFFEYLGLRQKGSNYPSVREKDILNYEIPIPPLHIQKQIVARIEELFGKIDKAIELRKKALEETEQIFQSALQEVFSKAEKKWEIKGLDKVCEKIFAGGDVPKDNFSKTKTEKYFIPIFSNGIEGKDLYGFTDIKKVTKPSVTISARGSIGYPIIRTEPFYPIIRLVVLIPNLKIIELHFLYYAMHYLNFSNTGTSIPQLTIPMVKNVKIPLPPLSEQKKIVSYLDNLREKVEKLKQLQQEQLKELTELKQSILTQFFRGRG